MSWGFALDPFGTVLEIIDSWKPRNCKTEKDFERSLSSLLSQKLKKQNIETQYGAGKQRINIVVDQKVPIEIKNNLNTTACLQRTVGQLDFHLKKWDRVILVLCGEVKSYMYSDLKQYAEEKTGLTLLDGERVFVINKGKTRI